METTTDLLTTGWRLHQAGDLARAEQAYQQFLQQEPGHAQGWYLLGALCQAQRKVPEAISHYQQAVQLNPGHAGAHLRLGAIYQAQGRLEEALAAYSQGARLQPDSADAHLALGTVHHQQGRLEEALANYYRALQLQPDYAKAHLNSAFALLQLGDYGRGWAEHEWRWRLTGGDSGGPTQPFWDGSPLAGRTILLYAEADYGLGDTIQFIRYARLVKEQRATVIVACQRPLLSLLARCPGIDRLVAHGDPLPAHEVRAPLLSLPHRVRTTLEALPALVPYLEADPPLVEQWRGQLAALTGYRIGIAWQGSPRYHLDKQRSMDLKEFAPLAAVPGVRLVSLQKGPGSEQARAVAEQWPLLDLAGRLDETAGPFMDTAAVMRSLDLVVTVDSSLGHLAGALGVPVWLALSQAACWRWMRQREDTPWYPTMRLFRQETGGDWGPVLRRIAQAVQTLLHGERSARDLALPPAMDPSVAQTPC